MSGAVIAALGLGLGSITKSLAGLIITYSIVTGVGFGLMYIPSIVAVANHFTRQRSLAIGICLCGAGVGTFALSPLETEITGHYGWRSEMFIRLVQMCDIVLRWGFLSLCLLSLSCVICGASMTKVIDSSCVAMIPNTQVMWKVERQPWIPAQPENITLASAPPESCYDKILGLVVDPGLYRNPAFRLYLLVAAADLAATLSLFIPFQHLPAVAHSHGVDRTHAAYIISVTSLPLIGQYEGGSDWFITGNWYLQHCGQSCLWMAV